MRPRKLALVIMMQLAAWVKFGKLPSGLKKAEVGRDDRHLRIISPVGASMASNL
ncbi:hypothetical protein QCN27_12980 [Cereibacter sp. SYSU M97828]|nr:hypothetical protein [Cereibacter flavus]